MPLYEFRCEAEHAEEHYVHTADDLGCRTYMCRECRKADLDVPLTPVPSFGRGLTYFESGRPRVIWNMGPEPVTVTSHEQHKRLMREHKVEWATKWQTQKTGGWV